jgi:abhydrolase domain-containing protein 6
VRPSAIIAFPRQSSFPAPIMVSSFPSLPAMNGRDTYRRAQPLILVNGLAEQGESWYPNRDAWQQRFDVHLPQVLVYDGPVIQQRLEEGGTITVDYLTGRLAEYLDNFVQSPPYHLAGSSLGGQIVVEYAARFPENVDRAVLLCPSGMGTDERLPIMEGARHKNYQGLVESTFHDRSQASPGIVNYYEEKFASRPWRRALFETVRGTKGHSVVGKLPLNRRPTLVIWGGEDRIVDPHAVRQAVEGLPNYVFHMIPGCGHAPQLEQPQTVNSLVADFLLASEPAEVVATASTNGA